MKKRHTTEEIITHLRSIERMLTGGATVDEACRQLGFGSQSYYRWKRKYGGMQPSEAHRTRELEKENQRLKKIVAELTIDNSILKEVAQGTW
ncbi:MAG: transposase IS3/IS911-family, orfA [Chlorobi bacterium]|nr:transposase IS3/IS911-family, orfA [Chlorobiota bacterium]